LEVNDGIAAKEQLYLAYPELGGINSSKTGRVYNAYCPAPGSVLQRRLKTLLDELYRDPLEL
jgi:hypothetical protein